MNGPKARWMYVTDWHPCARCGTLRPDRALMVVKGERPTFVCRDQAWCEKARAASGPPPRTRPSRRR
jgi:hypothetical protein